VFVVNFVSKDFSTLTKPELSTDIAETHFVTGETLKEVLASVKSVLKDLQNSNYFILIF